MPSEVILPRVDMDMATGKIAKWFVEPGAQVTKGQPLFEIETDKAAMEIEAPASGIIRDLATASSADIPVGSIVAWIFAEGEAPLSAQRSVASHATGSADAHPAEATMEPKQAVNGAHSAPTVAEGERPRATPMARRLAREHGLDLASLTGTGPRGRVQAIDIQAASRTPEPIQTTPTGDAAVARLSTAEPVEPPSQPGRSSARPPAGPRAADLLNLVRLRDGEGRPTVFVHGFGADIGNWRPYLAAGWAGRPALAIDLPGHGSSPLGAVTDFASLVDAVEAGIGNGGLGLVDLVGHSLGGAVCAAVAGRAGLDIRSLLLLSPAGLGPDINGAFLRGFLGATSEASLTPWMQELVADPAAITPAFVRATLRARDGSDLVDTQRRIAAAVFPDDTQSFSIRPDLARLTIPTRVVLGTSDRIIPARHAADLPALIATHRLPNVGHMPHLEASDVIARIHAQMSNVIA